MRVTTEKKEQTRQAILACAQRQFGEAGYLEATTRNIAKEAGIAAGTLFNYFPTKEDLGLALVEQGIASADEEFDNSRPAQESLEEQLFAYAAIQLRHLSPAREWTAQVFEAALSPLRRDSSDSLAGKLRQQHLERVSAWMRIDQGLRAGASESPVDLHLYWSLYLGVVAFWARDESHHQEDTLALLDRSTRLFCRALRDE